MRNLLKAGVGLSPVDAESGHLSTNRRKRHAEPPPASWLAKDSLEGANKVT